MAQRILIPACLAMVAACLAMVGIVLSESMRSAARSAEADRQLAELLSRTQVTNEEMLKHLQAMAKPAPPAKSQDWIPAGLKLTVVRPDGPPAVGFEAWLGRGDGGASKEGAIHRVSDSDGLVDFGVIQPGDWEYRLARKYGTREWTMIGNLNAIPGSPIARPILCPKVPPDMATVHVAVNWPSDLAKEDLRAVALFECYGPRYQPPRRWSLWNSKQVGWQRRQIVVDSKSKQADIGIQDLYLWRFPTEQEKKEMIYMSAGWGSESAQDPAHLFAILPSDALALGQDRVDLEEGEYSLERLVILRSVPNPKPALRQGSFAILSVIQDESNTTMVHLNARGPDGELTNVTSVEAQALAVRESYWRDVWGRFQARPGQANEWTIPLPDELLRAVREKLKDAKPK